MHGEVCGEGQGQDEGDAGTVGGFGDGREDEEIAEGRSRSSDTCSNCERIEEEAVHDQFMDGDVERLAYPAATARLVHLKSFLEDVNSRVATFCPLSAICPIALALRRSTTVYSRFVARGRCAGLGRSENNGSRRGAWWYTPPS